MPWQCYADDPDCGTEESRWECAQMAGWLGRDGAEPWDSHGGQLAFLASATPEELSELAYFASLRLNGGHWEGYRSENGGWLDNDPELDSWHAIAADFMERVMSGDRRLTEGMVAGATFDLACELAGMRGWCPSKPTRTCP